MAAVTANDMRDKLLTLDQYRERLAATEPISTVVFDTDGSGQPVRVTMGDDWAANLDNLNDTDPVDATIAVGRSETRMSKGALLTLARNAKIQGAFLKDTPARLVAPILDWKLANGTHNDQRQLMVHDGTVVAITKPSIVPFSNVRLVDSVAATLRNKYGGDILVDYKSRHSLRLSTARLIVPDVFREPRDNDPWSIGIETNNSLTGERPTEASGYAFRWWCTNGCTTDHSSGRWNRRASSQSPEEVYAWMADQIDDILSGMEGEFDKLAEAARTPLDGEVNDVLRDTFARYEVPLAVREQVINNMVESDDLTLYGVQAALTQAANAEERTPGEISRLLRAGGGLIHDTDRCDACHRAL